VAATEVVAAARKEMIAVSFILTEITYFVISFE
jgi:hypothetical protein